MQIRDKKINTEHLWINYFLKKFEDRLLEYRTVLGKYRVDGHRNHNSIHSQSKKKCQKIIFLHVTEGNSTNAIIAYSFRNDCDGLNILFLVPEITLAHGRSSNNIMIRLRLIILLLE